MSLEGVMSLRGPLDGMSSVNPIQQKILHHSIMAFCSLSALLGMYYVFQGRLIFACVAAVLLSFFLLALRLAKTRHHQTAFLLVLLPLLLILFVLYPFYRSQTQPDLTDFIGGLIYVPIALTIITYCGMLASRLITLTTAIFLGLSCLFIISSAIPDPTPANTGIPLMIVSISLTTALIVIAQTINQSNVTELRRQMAITRKANNAKSEFLNNMSHEFRTPMNIIFGTSELLKMDIKNPGQQKQLESLREAAGALLKILDDILDLDHSNLPIDDVQLAPFQPMNLLNKVCQAHGKSIEESGLKFDYPDISPDTYTYIGAAEIIERLLGHLLSNAEKFTEAGAITVTSELQASLGETFWSVSISDTGIGIPKAQQKRIFERFTQADSSLSRPYGGSGLGLALSKEWAQAMDGSLELVSSSEAGSVFRLTVPLAKA